MHCVAIPASIICASQRLNVEYLNELGGAIHFPQLGQGLYDSLKALQGIDLDSTDNCVRSALSEFHKYASTMPKLLDFRDAAKNELTKRNKGFWKHTLPKIMKLRLLVGNPCGAECFSLGGCRLSLICARSEIKDCLRLLSS